MLFRIAADGFLIVAGPNKCRPGRSVITKKCTIECIDITACRAVGGKEPAAAQGQSVTFRPQNPHPTFCGDIAVDIQFPSAYTRHI